MEILEIFYDFEYFLILFLILIFLISKSRVQFEACYVI